jgi:Asp-tRNA(Asn)/Glu-tRNA(Gln) amidotransferase B subunit
VAKVPEHVLNLIKDYDELSRAVKNYINADEGVIQSLRKAMKRLVDRRTARIDETRGVASALEKFNRERSGELTDQEKEAATRRYYKSPDLMGSLTLDGFLEVLKAKKAAKFIDAEYQSFRDYAPSKRAGELKDRIPSLAQSAVGILRDAVATVESKAQGPTQPPSPTRSEEMGISDEDADLDLNEA